MTAEDILIVDDDPRCLAIFEAALRLEGFTVRGAATVEAASRELTRCVFHLVVCDLQLSDGSGLDVLRHKIRAGSTAAFVIVTGFGSVRSAVEALRLGADDYLEKPLWIDRLIHVARTYVIVPATSGASPHPLVTRALELAGLHFQDPMLTPHQLAEWLDVSLAHLSRTFKASGIPAPGTTLCRLRLSRAQQLLRRSRVSVKEVAHSAGFRTVKQFERAFRRVHGIAPGDWRRAPVASAQPVVKTQLVRLDADSADDTDDRAASGLSASHLQEPSGRDGDQRDSTSYASTPN